MNTALLMLTTKFMQRLSIYGKHEFSVGFI